MSLSSLPTALLVPPVNLLLPCLGALVLLRRKPALARALLAAGLAGLFVLSLPIVADTLLVSLETNLKTDRSTPPGAVVILSADLVETANGEAVGPLTLEREQAGAALARRTGLPILVTGGRPPGDTDALAGLMAASLAGDFHAPPRWVEAQAQDTRENARFSAAMLLHDGIRSAYLVTHAWHMRRALLDFAGTGLDVTPSPVRLDPWPRPLARSFVPEAHAWQVSYWALHEWIGWLGARLGLRARSG